MNSEHAMDLARAGRLYPSVVLHGGSLRDRLMQAEALARTLLCLAAPDERPCGSCRHCRRIRFSGGSGAGDGTAGDRAFHPDVSFVERDLRTSTSIEAVKEMLRTAQVSPFEARGQVFVIAEAETLHDGAANALLKTLEEPGLGAPRHFLLLASTAGELLATLRSRSLLVYLNEEHPPADEVTVATVDELARLLQQPPPLLVPLRLAARLLEVGEWKDARAAAPWIASARSLIELSRRVSSNEWRKVLLDAAFEMLESQELRLRAVSPQRILEGVLSRNLASPGATPPVLQPGP